MKRSFPPALVLLGFLTYNGMADAPPPNPPVSPTAETATYLTNVTHGLAGADPRVFSHPDRIKYDAQCFTIDGKDVFIYSGSFHYFRCPKELWPARFQAIKDAGFNTVETYTAWNYHEREMPDSPSDFSKVTRLDELDDWLTMAEKYGLYTIVRPGPYICAEWNNGGYPRWMSTLEASSSPLRKEGWLRSDDPDYLMWCKHWYDAVCPIIAKHQITQKAPGQPGVILVQVENEYDYWRPFPADAKLNALNALVKDAQADKIDVPLFTCYTSQTRGAKSGPLRAVFDCTNFYPTLKVEKSLAKDLVKQRAEQPDAPLGTSELQAGWFAQVGGHLSAEQPGLTAAQIQNLTLFAWQLGDTMTNFYMVFGGTNFDDWAGGTNITSYDYNAPIREDGSTSERYQRVWALGQMLRDHGTKLARAQGVEIDAKATDSDVEVAERQAKDGSRYLFVRTENNSAARKGTANVTEKDGTKLSFDYALEPFGSMVLYLAPGVTDASKGEWLPKTAPAPKQPDQVAQAVAIANAERFPEAGPAGWQVLKAGASPETQGVFGSHYFYYRVPVKPGSTVEIQIQKNDGIAVTDGVNLLKGTENLAEEKAEKMSDKNPESAKVSRKGTRMSYEVPAGVKELTVLYENAGHQNFGPQLVGEPFGILSVKGATGPLSITTKTGFGTEQNYGAKLSGGHGDIDMGAVVNVPVAADAPAAPDSLLTWYRLRFKLPDKPATGISAPWKLHLEAAGNGFIYVNGHCIGRYWQAGPQHDFYIPEPWLNYGDKAGNRVAIDLRPVDHGVAITAASVVPDATFTVETAAAGQ